MKKFLAAAAFIVFALGCGPGRQDINRYKKEGWYPQYFKSQAALLVRERNDVIHIIASAGLLDKEEGIFFSAKHFVGGENDGTMKIFFNGKVYGGILMALPAITDIAIVGIQGSFDSAEFPEAYVLGDNAKKNDEIFVTGIHTHPPESQEGKRIIPIFLFYYDMPWRKDKFVLDELKAKVVTESHEINSKNIGGSGSEDISNTYVELKTDRDHKFSFSGLSGGPVVNARNEVIGVTANENQGGFVLDKEKGVVYHPWETLNIVPVAELKKLIPHLENFRK